MIEAGNFTLQEDQRYCYDEALRLQAGHGGKGEIWWVFDESLPEEWTGHCYYIPEGARLNDLALNAADNGYSDYPQLTVQEVYRLGIPY